MRGEAQCLSEKGGAMKGKFLKLRGRMTEMGFSRESLSKEIGMTYQCLCRRLSGATDFTLTEMETICKVLNITDPEVYFFEQ